jgi:hypothetical protein
MLAGLFFLASPIAMAQDATKPANAAETGVVDQTTTAAQVQSKSAGRVYVLIACGHPGDETHEVAFAASVTKLHTGLINNFGVREQDITVLFGEAESTFRAESNSTSKWITSSSECTRETLETAANQLTKSVRPVDQLWVFALGHSHHDRGKTWFNLVGPDVEQAAFAKLFANVKADRQLFAVTMPASGFYIRALSRPNRIVLTATEADLEINETIFAHSLADVVADPKLLPDADDDNRITAFDLYLATATHVAMQYAKQEFLSTEHALLDDNADKRGTEIQKHYLSEELGGLPKRRQRTELRPKADGVYAKRFVLSKPSSR